MRTGGWLSFSTITLPGTEPEFNLQTETESEFNLRTEGHGMTMELSILPTGYFIRNSPLTIIVSVTDYGDTCNKHPLYTWDDGHRTLVRCKNCGGYALVQFSEFHAFSDGNDSYYCDMFPVSGAEEAEQLNRDFDGYQIEGKLQGKYLVRDNNDAPHWMRDMTDY